MRTAPATAVPVAARDLNAVPEQQVAATMSSHGESMGVCAVPSVQRTTHEVSTIIDYANRAVAVQQIIRYTNVEATELAEIVLNAEMTRYPGALMLRGLTLATGVTPEHNVTGQQLNITLAEPLAPGCTIELTAEFDLLVPPVGAGIEAYKGFFGYSSRQMNLALWLLTPAVRRNGTWVTHEAFAIGEQSVLDIADWQVVLEVQNAPETLIVAAPGLITETEPMHWRIVFEGSRDFAISLSDAFVVSSRQTSTGVTVELYSYADAVFRDEEGDLIDSPDHALHVAVQSLELFSRLFGTYPHTRFVVVQGDFPDGMEFSGMVFVSSDWFYGNRGAERNYLTIITAHEVAHQWWYAQVGSDQALDPFLDEALATYSEALFYNEFYPDSLGWWWEFRINRLAPEGFVDSSVYEFPSIRAYINAVYLRGVRMLNDLRIDLGDEAFFAWLRRYAEVGAQQVVTPNLFWSLLDAKGLEKTRATRFAYLRNPEILTEADAEQTQAP